MSSATSPKFDAHSARHVAQQWLKRNPVGQGGFVIVQGKSVPGWTLHLDRPSAWSPGCIAVPVTGGTCHVATGGTRQSGAATWQPGITAPVLPPSAVGLANGVSMSAKGDAVKIQHASDLAHELTPEGRTFKRRHSNPHGD